MALPFFETNGSKKRDQVFAIDLGGRITKAAYLQRKGDSYSLSKYALMDAPIFEKSWSVELLSEHLKTVARTIAPKTKQVTIAVDVNDLVVRTIEMPMMPLNEMRQILKVNGKTFLQQELTKHIFDCYVFPSRADKGAGGKSKPDGTAKAKVLVAGAKSTLLDDLQNAIKNAGLVPDLIIPSIVGPVNAFEKAMPEVFTQQVVALVDIGFKSSTISLLQEGELILTRIVNVGGDKLTSGLAEMMSISYAEAEGIKIGMPGEVQQQLEMLVAPLGSELRASINFFEHQQDRTVSTVYLSGGSARSECMLQALHAEMAVECKTWNPTGGLQLDLQPAQTAEVEHVAPQLTVAIGAALTTI